MHYTNCFFLINTKNYFRKIISTYLTNNFTLIFPIFKLFLPEKRTKLLKGKIFGQVNMASRFNCLLVLTFYSNSTVSTQGFRQVFFKVPFLPVFFVYLKNGRNFRFGKSSANFVPKLAVSAPLILFSNGNLKKKSF